MIQFKDGPWALNEADSARRHLAFVSLLAKSSCTHDTATHWKRCPDLDAFECIECGTRILGYDIYRETVKP